ncbi:MAG: hypothetical protein IJY15_14600, partial [Thermoguttaceae bacterium]|nr:hypothetical protein [Thermoguttaceae bacterium]
MSNETAILVLSGKILDAPFPLTSLDAIRTAIERETLTRGVPVVRRVATLAPSRFFAAPEFLKAGFEVVPADDEDVQATAVLFDALLVSPAPTEILFALGLPEPLELLRALAGRTRRVLLTTADVSPTLEDNLEGLYDLRALLTDAGVDWDSLDANSWRRSDAPAASAASPNPASPNPANPAPSDAVAPSSDDLCALAPEVGPSAVELDAPAWNAALEEVLLANDLVCPAYLATEKISARFPELPEFFLTRREEFRRLLSPQILMVEENSATRLYHKTHPDYRPIASSAAVESLKIGSEAAPSETDDAIAAKRRDAEETLDLPAIVARVQTIAQECRRLAAGFPAFPDDETALPQDGENSTRSKPTFPRSFARRLTPDELKEAAQCYEIAAKAFELFAQVVDLPRDRRHDHFFSLVAQATANAQCGLKSVLSRLNVSLAAEETQRAAYELLLSLCGPRGVFLANLRFHDRLTFAETLDVGA